MSNKGFQTSTLIESIRCNSVSGVIKALEAGADIEEPDMHGTPGLPLRTACFEGNEAIVRELLARGAKPNTSASDGPNAPLRLALRCNHQDIAALLLQEGAQHPDSSAIEPLTVATQPTSSLPGCTSGNIIEFTRSEETHPPETDQATADYCGADTNALSMDLLFLDMKDAQQDFNNKTPTDPTQPPA